MLHHSVSLLMLGSIMLVLFVIAAEASLPPAAGLTGQAFSVSGRRQDNAAAAAAANDVASRHRLAEYFQLADLYHVEITTPDGVRI
jgi:hypothetical protein